MSNSPRPETAQANECGIPAPVPTGSSSDVVPLLLRIESCLLQASKVAGIVGGVFNQAYEPQETNVTPEEKKWLEVLTESMYVAAVLNYSRAFDIKIEDPEGEALGQGFLAWWQDAQWLLNEAWTEVQKEKAKGCQKVHRQVTDPARSVNVRHASARWRSAYGIVKKDRTVVVHRLSLGLQAPFFKELCSMVHNVSALAGVAIRRVLSLYLPVNANSLPNHNYDGVNLELDEHHHRNDDGEDVDLRWDGSTCVKPCLVHCEGQATPWINIKVECQDSCFRFYRIPPIDSNPLADAPQPDHTVGLLSCKKDDHCLLLKALRECHSMFYEILDVHDLVKLWCPVVVGTFRLYQETEKPLFHLSVLQAIYSRITAVLGKLESAPSTDFSSLLNENVRQDYKDLCNRLRKRKKDIGLTQLVQRSNNGGHSGAQDPSPSEKANLCNRLRKRKSSEKAFMLAPTSADKCTIIRPKISELIQEVDNELRVLKHDLQKVCNYMVDCAKSALASGHLSAVESCMLPAPIVFERDPQEKKKKKEEKKKKRECTCGSFPLLASGN